MKIISYLLIITLILCGCSSTYQINSTADAKKMLEEKDGSLFLINNEKYDANDFHISGDSLTFANKSTHELKTIAFQDITQVQRLNRSRGVGRGLLIGAGSVLVSGLIWRIVFPPTFDLATQRESAVPGAEKMRAVVVIAGGTVLGGLIGAGVGEYNGISESCIFNQDSLGANSHRMEFK
jgi:hypothetical protein